MNAEEPSPRRDSSSSPEKRASITQRTPRRLSFSDSEGGGCRKYVPPPPPQQLSLSPSSSIERTIHARELTEQHQEEEEFLAGLPTKSNLRVSPLRPVREEVLESKAPPSPFQDAFKDLGALRSRGVTLSHFETQDVKGPEPTFEFPIPRRISAAATMPTRSPSPMSEQQKGSLSSFKRLSITKSRKMSLPSEANRRAALVSATDSSLPAEIKAPISSSSVGGAEHTFHHSAVPDLTRRASFIKRVTIEPRRASIPLARKLSLHRPIAGTSPTAELDAEQSGEFPPRALNFEPIMEEKRRQHYPETREWLIKHVVDWMANPEDKKLFWLMGDAGMGKSVVAVKVMDRLGARVVGWHFCRHDDPASSQPSMVIKSLCAMLCQRLAGFEEQLLLQDEAARQYSMRSDKVEDVFKTLILDPISRVAPPESNMLLVWDALDELPRGARVRSQALSLLTNYFSRLPSWLLIFVTSRGEFDIVQSLKSKYTPYEMTVDQETNRADLRAFLSHLANRFSKSMSIEDIEMALEFVKDRQGELVFPGLNIRGKLAPLAEHMERSKAIFEEAAKAYKHENGFQELLELKDVMPPNPPMQENESLDVLFQHAEEARTRLAGWIASKWEDKPNAKEPASRQAVPQTLMPWVEHATDRGLRGRKQALEKIAKENNNDPRLLTDLARQTLSYETCLSLHHGLQYLQSEEPRKARFELMQLKNKFGNPTPMGYRDFAVTIRVEAGSGHWHICEVQLNLNGIVAAKAEARQCYDKVRALLPDICASCSASPELLQYHIVKFLKSSVRDSVIRTLEDKAQGVFLYAKLLEDHLGRIEREQQGLIQFDQLMGLPHGLGPIYQDNFFRAFPDGPKGSAWRASAHLVALVVVAQEPLPVELASRILGPAILRQAQNDLSLLFPVTNSNVFRVLHKSVVDWLRNQQSAFHVTPEEMAAAHRDLGQQTVNLRFRLNLSRLSVAELEKGIWGKEQGYCFRHGVRHLIEADLARDAGRLMLDEDWLRARGSLGDLRGIKRDAALLNIATQMPYYDMFLRNFLNSFQQQRGAS